MSNILIYSTITTSTAGKSMQHFINPVVYTIGGLATLLAVLLLVVAGFWYISSAGDLYKIEKAKKLIKNTILGLIIVLGSGMLVSFLTHTYSSQPGNLSGSTPIIKSIHRPMVNNSIAGVLIQAITGLINLIIQSAAGPFLSALNYFTTSTPLIVNNSSVFNLWLAMVGIADAAFVLLVALLGLHFMSFTILGINELEFKHLLPRIILIFILMNTSVFMIDGIIEFSNALITALNSTFSSVSIWKVLTALSQQANSFGIAALFLMIGFLALAVILLVYYIGRLVTIYLGAVLSPLILMLWLLPAFKDFAENAAKTYFSAIFVLFVQVVILQLAASLLSGLIVNHHYQSGNQLMALVVGISTLVALLKAQGVMSQFSYASMGPKAARRLGGHLASSISAARQSMMMNQ